MWCEQMLLSVVRACARRIKAEEGKGGIEIYKGKTNEELW